MKSIMALVRPVLLAAALICLVLATLFGFEILSHGRSQILVTCAWGVWGGACYVGSKIAGELAS